MPLPGYIEPLISDKKVASVVPTRSRCARKFLSDLELSPDATVVEYGPGNGVFTKILLSKLSKKARLFAFETNPKLSALLQDEIKDPRLTVFEKDAQVAVDVLGNDGLRGVDLVLSGIPLSFLNHDARMELFRKTKDLLKPGGVFLIYQTAWTPFKADSKIVTELTDYFSLIDRDFFWFNIPPLVALYLSNPVKQ